MRIEAVSAQELGMIGSGNLQSFQGAMGQDALRAPTVFNFYLPDFQQPGPLFASKDRYSPEFQITNESSAYTTANLYYGFTASAYQGMAGAPTNRPLIDLSSLQAPAAPNVAAIVAAINSSMLYGTMSASMNTHLTSLLNQLNNGGTSPAEMAWSAIYVTMLSPEYATQR